MGNASFGIKRIFINKTTVTLFGLVLSIAIIFFSYNNRINSATRPIEVPYAKVKIASGTQITSKMVGTTKVPPSMLEGDVITSAQLVVDKYSNADTVIPKGSLFYTRTVVDKEKLPANIILDYPSGYVLYSLDVNARSTYGNSMYPGNYIDVWVKVERNDDADTSSSSNNFQSKDSKIMFAKLLSHVKIIAVKDRSGNAVFDSTDTKRTPAMIIFAIPEEYYILLKKTEYLRTYSSQIVPVPTNEKPSEVEKEVENPSSSMKDWINNVTVWTDY